MSTLNAVLIACLLLLYFSNVVSSSSHGTSNEERKTYIVYMGDKPKGEFSASTLHNSMLKQIVGSGVSEYLIHSYHRSFNGFAAKLTENEKHKMAEMEGVVSVFLSQKKKLHTTRSWNFMHFPMNATRSTYESNVIVGILDSGVWPESQSFSDKGFDPPPSKWKGTCQGNSNFTCNNKIIGARYYNLEGEVVLGGFNSPRDSVGHGTHTASTVAGEVVGEASLLGLGSGTARGGVPSARIAVYKICWVGGCSDIDILAAFDDAIADGVDLISISVGGSYPSDYFEDVIAIGAFHSMKNGILTSNSAGNSGPSPMWIPNCSPWSLTVAASTIDRKFVTKLKLGNGAIYEGVSLNTFSPPKTSYPIIYSGNAVNASYIGIYPPSLCSKESLNKTLIAGKIVLCNGFFPQDAYAISPFGIVSNETSDLAFPYAVPVSVISPSITTEVLQYLNSTSEPTATIFKTIEYKDELAPYVASFSSRGPNPITPDILKPDLTAPGVDILAAWSEANTLTGFEGDTRVVQYSILSGTSMSCPHASAAAAYVKSFQPSFSPAAIKSALMTTAYPMRFGASHDAEFGYGSGHINPAKAADPGLVYDAEETDYVKLLCGQGYNTTQLRLVTGDRSACSEQMNGTVWDMNYPSFAVSILPGETHVTRVFRRTVTNVGSSSCTYKAIIKHHPSRLNIQVQPNVLSFESVGQKQSFTVTVEANLSDENPINSGSLVWEDGVHKVRSPIVAFRYVP